MTVMDTLRNFHEIFFALQLRDNDSLKLLLMAREIMGPLHSNEFIEKIWNLHEYITWVSTDFEYYKHIT
jgi:hypothetical protein